MSVLIESIRHHGSPERGYFSREELDHVASGLEYDTKISTILWHRIHQIGGARIGNYICYTPPGDAVELGIVDPDGSGWEMSKVNADTLNEIIHVYDHEFHRPRRIGAKVIGLSKAITNSLEARQLDGHQHTGSH